MSTPMEDMIAMSRGSQRGRAALQEDSPMEAPVSGFNRHMSLMAPATREMVLKSRTLDIEKFAESRQLNTSAVLHIAEAAMRLGRVPDLRQYGFSGDDAKAIKQFIAGDVLNLAIEQLDAMDTINEAMTDREASTVVRALAAAGANVLLKKNEDRTPGYTKALNCLKAGDLLTIRNMLGENLVSFGAAKALICAMNAAPKKTREEIQAEATNTAGIASYMSLASNMAHARPRTMVNAERATRIEDEKTAMKIGPRLGASPFETDVLTLEGIAAKYQEAQAVDEAYEDTKKASKKLHTQEKAAKTAREREPGDKKKLKSFKAAGLDDAEAGDYLGSVKRRTKAQGNPGKAGRSTRQWRSGSLESPEEKKAYAKAVKKAEKASKEVDKEIDSPKAKKRQKAADARNKASDASWSSSEKGEKSSIPKGHMMVFGKIQKIGGGGDDKVVQKTQAGWGGGHKARKVQSGWGGEQESSENEPMVEVDPGQKHQSGWGNDNRRQPTNRVGYGGEKKKPAAPERAATNKEKPGHGGGFKPHLARVGYNK